MKKKSKGLLYYIYCALGEKSHPNCNKTADRVALIRLLIALQLIITNFFIIGGVIVNIISIHRHWNDVPKVKFDKYIKSICRDETYIKD
jgi:hypothetical protein